MRLLQRALAGMGRGSRITPGGDEQVTGFYLSGEYIDIDELPGESHRGYVQVIDDCAVHQLSPWWRKNRNRQEYWARTESP